MKKESTQEERDIVREQLKQIRCAVMYNLSERPEHLPNDIVQFECMDDQGQIWVSLAHPKFETPYLETSFPVQLCFFRKSVDYFIEVEGVALLDGLPMHQHDTLLLKVKPSALHMNYCKEKKWGELLKEYQHQVIEKLRQLFQPKKENQYGY
ncbi:hypothetical protein WG954_17060 [Lacibacter sp. H375]|uniref:hypothetical protein n=1 Tax=Lacibacter sp. H375 TaxID=3133424 RepID=UPI0030C357C6